jgi:hypothetical protein
MNSPKAAIRLTEWDREKDVLTPVGYEFRFNLSESPDPIWQECFDETSRRASAHLMNVSLRVPGEKGRAQAVVFGKPTELEDRLYPMLKNIVDETNRLFDERCEAQRVQHQKQEAARLSDEKALSDLKKRFVV